jgi:hypothetical protein
MSNVLCHIWVSEFIDTVANTATNNIQQDYDILVEKDVGRGQLQLLSWSLTWDIDVSHVTSDKIRCDSNG